MQDEHSQDSRHTSSSIPPLALDALRVPDDHEGGLLANVDARALTSVAALCVAMMVVVAIAIVGHMKHTGNASSTEQTRNDVAPLVNEGVEIPAPAINIGHLETAE